MRAFELSGPAGRLTGWSTGAIDAPGTPVLLVHPINMRGACWADVARALGDRLCLMPDLRGHGGSDPDGPYGLEAWGADLLAVLDFHGVSRAHVVGGSLGGPLAIQLAVTAPERVASITAIGSALRIEGDDVEAVLEVLDRMGVAGMFRDVLPKISMAAGAPGAVVERAIALANPNDVPTVAAVWGATIAADATPLSAHVTCPAHVVSGALDVTCTPEQGAVMAAALGTELQTLPGVGHLPMLEAPRALAAIVRVGLDATP